MSNREIFAIGALVKANAVATACGPVQDEKRMTDPDERNAVFAAVGDPGSPHVDVIFDAAGAIGVFVPRFGT